jgi:uncharacterized protein involved in type VI secretion and phage assembly
MSNGFINAAAQSEAPDEHRILGVAVAQVTDNRDPSGQGMVKIHLPGMPQIEPWARVAAPMAGPDRGTYFIPQQEDEVLVVFNRGDVREPYIIGSLWNGQDRPPATEEEDPVNKRLIRTPQGHEILFDDDAESITITSSSDHKITIEPSKIELETAEGEAKITMDTDAKKITIEATESLELKAPQIKLEGEDINLQASNNTMIRGGSVCDVRADIVKIN